MKGKWVDRMGRLRIGAGILLSVATLSLPAQAQQNTTTLYEYDTQGNLKKITDPRGKVTDLTVDALNRVTLEQRPPPASGQPRPTIGAGYDGLDRILSVTDPKNLTTTYTVDGLNNLTALSSPDAGTTPGGSPNTYDEAGNLKTLTDARGKVSSFQYDALNRPWLITFSDSTPSVFFEYDTGTNAKGRRSAMQDAAGTTVWFYESLGRVEGKAQIQGSITHTVSYIWGTSGTGKGRLIGTLYPSGIALYRQYDSAGRTELLALVTPSAQQILLYYVGAYSPFGAPTAVAWIPNGLTRVTGYDLDGRMVTYTRDGDYRALDYDAASRIQGVLLGSKQSVIETYSYDDLNRVIQWNRGTTTQNFSYDTSGNRTSLEIVPNSYSYAYSNPFTSNQLQSTSGPSPAKTNSYDDAGNLLGDGTQTFVHDARGRLVQVTRGSVVTDYVVNGVGQRVRKTVNSGPLAGTTYFVYDEDGHLLGEYDGSGSAIQEYVWDGDTPVAIIRGTASSPVIYSIETDQVGTPRQVRDANQVLRWQWDTDPFGNSAPDENPASLGTFTLNLRFPGQYFDKETNLHYNYFRDYDPAIGRYIQSDPIGLAGGINTYAYVGSNPLSGADPMGLACVAVGGRVTCSSANGPTFSLPQPPGFSSFISGYDPLDHTYRVTRNVPKGLEECVMQGLINNPTPGNPRPATPNGTTNNAVVTPPFNNWVTSYLTNDPVSGLPLVVNLSGPGAQFPSGYVARGVANGVAFTYGQGNNFQQAPFPSLQNIGNQAVWGSQLDKIIENCRCR